MAPTAIRFRRGQRVECSQGDGIHDMFFVSQTGSTGRRVRQANRRELVMATKLYVGNLPYTATNQSLEQMFGDQGEVRSAEVIMDRDTGRSKGFGFVEMADSKAAQAAIDALNGKDVDGRKLTVNEARPKEERSGGGGGRSGGYGGGRGYGGGGGYGGRGY